MTLPQPPCSGVVYNDGKTWIPLTSLDVHISIVDTSSRVNLTQSYFHGGPGAIEDAYYMFPLPPNGAVCGFHMETDDGTCIEGVVKEVGQARQDYEQAVQDNRMASLLEQFRQDIFVLSLGSFFPHTRIKISISFVMDLSNDDEHQNESVRFVLPTWVGHRYGVPETSRLHTLQGTAHNAGLNIMLDVQMSGEIFDITSNYLLQDLPPPAQMNGLHLARKQFQRPQQAHLHEAFMVVVQANGLDEQRCFLEEWNGWAALSLNLVPRFESLRVSRPSEYIFLIDHSGSMSIDNKMKEARETLKILLHALPETAWFNVYKFDHTYESLWHRSCQVSSFFREAALRFTENITADGGTKLLSALTTVLGNRQNNLPTNIFILTDGQVGDPRACIDAVRRAVSVARPDNPLRVFTFAFGHDASMELCEGLASAGMGSCSSALGSEQLLPKCMNLWERVTSNQVRNLRIDWGLGSNVPIWQTPLEVNLLSKKRAAVSALIQVPNNQVPRTILLSGEFLDGSPFACRIPVNDVHNRPLFMDSRLRGLHRRPLLHTIAAHKLILDLERGVSPQQFIPNWLGLNSNSQDDALRRTIVSLGTKYQLVSSQTAFVAVDAPPLSSEGQSTPPPSNTSTPPEPNPTPNGPGQSSQESSPSSSPYGSASSHSTDPSSSSQPMPGAFHASPPATSYTIQTLPGPSCLPDEVVYFFGGNAPPGIFIAPPLPLVQILVRPMRQVRSFVSRNFSNLGRQINQMTGGYAADMWNKLFPGDTSSEFRTKLGSLIGFQAIDGSFEFRGLSNIVGCPSQIPTHVVFPESYDKEKVWATAIAVAYLRKTYPQQWHIWKESIRKSISWGRTACGGTEKFEEIAKEAQRFI